MKGSENSTKNCFLLNKVIYTHTFICSFVCVCVYTGIYRYTWLCMPRSICLSFCVYVWVHRYVVVHLVACAHITYIHLSFCVCVCVYTGMQWNTWQCVPRSHTFVYVCVCVYTDVQWHTWLCVPRSTSGVILHLSLHQFLRPVSLSLELTV